MDSKKQLNRSYDIATKGALVLQKRAKIAQEHFAERMKKAWAGDIAKLTGASATPRDPWSAWYGYATDFAQRSVLLLGYAARARQQLRRAHASGASPVPASRLRTVVDGRKLVRPVTLRAGADRSAGRRGDRREKTTLRDHRPARGPRPGHRRLQGRLAGGRRAPQRASGLLRRLLPRSGARSELCSTCATRRSTSFTKCARCILRFPKPAIIGNCQGGWAAMMLAASDQDEHRSDRDQRRADVLLGRRVDRRRRRQPDALFRRPAGRHVALLAYRGHGRRHLRRRVPGRGTSRPESGQHVLGQVLPPLCKCRYRAAALSRIRALVAGSTFMNREEIEWITRNLFVGNKLWTGATQGLGGKAFDLRSIKAPIVLFASMGDNITPPQQAFNWVADVYGSTDEIKARADHRRPTAPGRRASRHLRLRQGRQGARADRLRPAVDRVASARPLGHGDLRAQGRRRQSVLRGRVRGARARGGRPPPESIRARRREAVRGGGHAIRVQPARLRALRATLRASDVQRVHRKASPVDSIRYARSAGRSRISIRGCRGSAPRRRWSATCERKAAMESIPALRRMSEKAGAETISASLNYREMPRRTQRGIVFPGLRKRVLAVPRRQGQKRREWRGSGRRGA